MKTRELSSGEKQTILKLRDEGKLIRAFAQALAIACTRTRNVLKKKETAAVLSNRHRTGRPRKTAVGDRNGVTSVSDITINLHRAGVTVSQSSVQRGLGEQQQGGYITRCKPLIGRKNRKVRLQFAMKYSDEPLKFWNKVLCTDETQINLYQSSTSVGLLAPGEREGTWVWGGGGNGKSGCTSGRQM